MAEKKIGCGTIFVIVVVIGACIGLVSKCNASSAVTNYMKGNYSKALKTLDKTSVSDMNSTQLYVYSELVDRYYSDSSKEEELKVKAYNKMLNDEKEVTEFKEKLGKEEYDSFMEWGQELYNKQQAAKAKQQYIGTWVATSPKDFAGLKFQIYENGTCNFVGSGKWYFSSDGTASCVINGEDAYLKISNGKLVYTATAYGQTVSVYFKKN